MSTTGSGSSKTALVTGAYKGLGYEVARQLLEKGFEVIITARKVAAGEKAAESLARETRGKTSFVVLDVTDDESIAEAAKEIEGLTDHLDVVVNNAGVFPDPEKSPLETDRTMLLEAFSTNAIGPMRVTQALAPLLANAKGGARVVNVSSGLGALGDMQATGAAYGISKTALNAVTRQLAAALKDRNITVNSVCPGWCKTDMGGPQAPRSPQEGASGIVWLATDAPKGATGKFWRDQSEIAW